MLWRRAQDGNIVGAKAREQLGSDILWPKASGDPAASAINALRQLVAFPQKSAVEIPMYRDGLYARADALVPTQEGYVLRETKAAIFPLKKDKVTPDSPKLHHVEDLAIQAWVYEATELPLAAAELNLLNGRWQYPGHNDYIGLFLQLNVTPQVSALTPQVPGWLRDAEQTLAGPMPDLRVGKQCKDPYGCPFIDHCTHLEPPGPEHPIDLLPGSGGKGLARRLTSQRGYTSLLDPKPGEFTGSDAILFQRMQIAHRTGKAILEPQSAAAFATLPYPRYYFDFEGIDLAVPLWVGVRPYEQIPFQWSCHIEAVPGRFEHAEFLDLSGTDPSVACIQRMIEVIPPESAGPIFVYYQVYERGRLRDLAERHPEYAGPINQYIRRLVDLHPMTRANYYHPAMRGSFSIKTVLPTIAPDLDYTALNEVQDGTGAQVAYLFAALEPTTTPKRKEELRHHLLAYCKRDTWAMVELSYFLHASARPN